MTDHHARFKEIVFPVEDRLNNSSFDMPIDIQPSGKFDIVLRKRLHILIPTYRRDSSCYEGSIKRN
jgi:hypothetical protein